MTETSKESYDPSNGLADAVFWRTFLILFVGFLTGILAPLLNWVIYSSVYENAGWFSRIFMDITGPSNYAHLFRIMTPIGFSILAAILAFLTAFLLAAMTFYGALLEDKEERKLVEQPAA